MNVIKIKDDSRSTCSIEGAATRMRRHRLFIGAMSLLVLFAQRIIRIFDMYFSIVRRRAACASRDNESASLIITTARRGQSNNLYHVDISDYL